MAHSDNEVMSPPLINALPIFEAWRMWGYLSSPLPIIAKLKKKTKWAEQDSNLGFKLGTAVTCKPGLTRRLTKSFRSRFGQGCHGVAQPVRGAEEDYWFSAELTLNRKCR
jgi:hypothetical protein